MKSLSVMFKPVSSACNMTCSYCFYRRLREKSGIKDYGYASVETAKAVIDRMTEYCELERYLAFQGGEPLLRGIDFYEEVFAYAEKRKISLYVQTNGILVDERWCKLFLRYKVTVGISLDGNGALNAHRLDLYGNETLNKVEEKLALLRKFKVEHNVLAVITKESAAQIKEICDYFVSIDERYIQFIPCLSYTEGESSQMTQAAYYDYLKISFDCYFDYLCKGAPISIRHIDNLLLAVNHIPTEMCGYNGSCSEQYAIESDGTVFPCDFYCGDDYRLGNVALQGFAELAQTQTAKSFRKAIVLEKCKGCKYYLLCKGGCKRENETFDRCLSMKAFFDYALDKLKSIKIG